MGLAGYYRKFVPKYADIARPLTNLTKQDVPYEWTNRCQQTFEFVQSWNRFGDTGILPAGDQIWDALERDLGWPSCLVSHWSTGVQWPWWTPWWLDSCNDTLGRGSSIKGKGLLLPVVISCWICLCELQSMLLRRYWTWRAVSSATHLLVAAPTETVVWSAPQLSEQPHQWLKCPTRSSLTGSKEHLPTASTVVFIRAATLVTGAPYEEQPNQ